MLYGLQMIDMALFMCGRASGIDSAKKLNDGDKAVLKIVDVIRITPEILRKLVEGLR